MKKHLTAVPAENESLTTAALESLRLPALYDEATAATALEIDAVLGAQGREGVGLATAFDRHGQAANQHLLLFHPKHTLETRKVAKRLVWPEYLFIPAGADWRGYRPVPAPANRRYRAEWTSPASTANHASLQDGTLYSYSILYNEAAGTSRATEAGLGVLYTPSMSLGVVDFQPHVDCSGTLRTLLEYPQQSSGYVEVQAHLLLAAWHSIPTGFDLVSWKAITVATSGRRDRTYGPEMQHFQKSFAGADLSAPFLVQGGRTYLLGVIARLSVISTLKDANGAQLPKIGSEKLKVWGVMNCAVPRIEVRVQRVDLP